MGTAKISGSGGEEIGNVRLVVGSVEVVLGYELVAAISSELPDSEIYTEIFATLAKHRSARVREHIADKDHLDEATVERLIKDDNIEVLRKIVDSEPARQRLTTEQLLHYINKDSELAKNIANSLGDFEVADISVLSRTFAHHPDPSVRGAFVNSFSASKADLKRLLKDSDPDVSRLAAERLE